MCVNDILASGGEPLFFLDYISSSKIEKKSFLTLINSIHSACVLSNCSLIGGETAEMPGLYKPKDFDLAGFTVGVVERKNLLKKENINNGDLIIGIESNGIHSNGFSMIRKILEIKKINLNYRLPFSSKQKIGDELLKPTKIYVNEVLPLIKKQTISSIAHITGGGIYENLARIIPKGYVAVIDNEKFKIPHIFLWLQELGSVDNYEMLSTFNCGIGLILVIPLKKKKIITNYFKKVKIKSHLIGEIQKKKTKQKVIIKKFGKWLLK